MRSSAVTAGALVAAIGRARRHFASGKRGLVNEILTLQIVNAAIIGGFAIAVVYWGGQWVLQDSYGRWARQWAGELNELGAPLFLTDDDDALLNLESFIDKYPEIRRVSYYAPDGQPLASLAKDRGTTKPRALGGERLREARRLIGSDEPYLLSSSILNARRFDIVAPIWTEALSEDTLLGLDGPAADGPERIELMGYVGIETRLSPVSRSAAVQHQGRRPDLIALLAIFVWASRRALQRALASISDLQAPIRELAKGNLDVDFKPAEHREISDIVEALRKTVAALSERDARLLELANHDGLTGLYNRRRFVEELKSELGAFLTGRRTSALFFIDLDRFKYVNDSCGHSAGDRLIRRVADELTRSVEPTTRLLASAATIRCAAQGTRPPLRQVPSPTRPEKHQAAGAFRGRACIACPLQHRHCVHRRAGTGTDELIAQADIACHEAKAAGRNRIAYFEASDDVRAGHRPT